MELWAATCLWVDSLLCQSHLPTRSTTSLRPLHLPLALICTCTCTCPHSDSACLLLFTPIPKSYLPFQIVLVHCRPLVRTTRPILFHQSALRTRGVTPISCPAPNLPCHSTCLAFDKPFYTDRSLLPLPCTTIAPLEQPDTVSINTSPLSATTMLAYSP